MYSFVFLSFVCVMCNNAVLVLGLASKAGIAQKNSWREFTGLPSS